MKDKFLPILLAGFFLASCSSVYRSGQTPDDVYYSPVREVAKVEEDNKEEEEAEDKTASAEDQYIKMKVRNRYRWNSIDDYSYWNDTRYNHCNCYCNTNSFGYGYNYNPYYNPIRYSTWNNPIYPVFVFGGTRNIKTSTSASNIKAYSNTTYSNTNNTRNVKSSTGNNGSNGSLIKRVFTSSGSEVDRSQRTYGSGSSSGGSSSAGGRSGGSNTTGSGSTSGKSRGN